MRIFAPITTAQVALLLGYVQVITYWAYAEWLEYTKNSRHKAHEESPKGDEESAALVEKPGTPSGKSSHSALQPTSVGASVRLQLFKLLTMNETALLENRLPLRAAVEFGGLILYYYICDRTDIFAEGQKHYNRDLFIFIYAMLVVTSLFTSLAKHTAPSVATGKSIQYLNRHQTEEWKGWMQVIFLLYHYFEAKEIYNSIRIFIAAYVWMTGFGNFSYYYVRKDFSLGRFCQMMWRLNFLVFFCCIALSNDYMLYYICPMHTLFTIMVYAALGIYSRLNDRPPVIALKFLACFAIVMIVWEVPVVFETLWAPFTFLMGYVDPRRPDLPILHEWHFRSGLDRYIWIVGMIYAYFHPAVERLLERLEEMEAVSRRAYKTLITLIAVGVGYVWFVRVYCLDKLEYNKLHPYTSWIPITVYITLRNITQPLRNWSIMLFGWLGKITLETYIGQFHIWLRSSTPNGQPKGLLSFLPADYPMVNFAIITAIYVVVSLRLFELTNTLKNAYVPNKDNSRLVSNSILGAILAGGLYLASFIIMNTMGGMGPNDTLLGVTNGTPVGTGN